MSRHPSMAGHITPPFRRHRRTWQRCIALVDALLAADPALADADAKIERVRREASSADVNPEHHAAFAVVISVLCDLRLQGWSFRKKAVGIVLERPTSLLDPALERNRIR